MKNFSIIFLIIFQFHSKMLGQNNSDDKELTVGITDLQRLSEVQCQNVESLYLYDSLKVSVGHDIVNDDIINRQGLYQEVLYYLYKFKGIKRIHFLNIFLNNIPESIITLQDIEEMSILFVNFSDYEAQIKQLLKMPKLRLLILNEDFIGENHFNSIKNALSNKGIRVISD